MRVASCGLALAAAACGVVKGNGPADAAKTPDADLRDADLTGTAAVITQTHVPGGAAAGMSQANVDVVSLLPNGMVHDQITTDATGHGSIKVYPGGSVTAIYRHTLDMGADLVTFTSVKPNDTLTFGKTFGPATSTSLGSETFTWPAPGGATQDINIFWPCGGFGFAPTTTSGSFPESDACNHSPMGVQGVALTFNPTFAVVAMSFSQFNFTANASQGLNGWITATNGTANLSGLDPLITNATFQLTTVANGGNQLFSIGTSAAPTGGSATITQPWVAVGERTLSTVFLTRLGPFFSQRVLDALTTINTTINTPPLPPWLPNNFLSSAAARMVVWLPVGSATHDGNVVQTNWNHTTAGVTSQFAWNFITPPDTSTIVLPTLPALFSDTQPHPEDFMGTRIDLVRIPSISGYDAFRAIPEAQLTCLDCAVRSNLIPRVIISGS
jgi:hypothetical protein